MATIEKGSLVTEVDVVPQATTGALLVTVPGFTLSGGVIGNGPSDGPAVYMENDPGTVTGIRYVRSPEVDEDYRLRTATDQILDRETFNYTAQNTGKHSHTFTTITATVSANGLLLNSGSGVATNTGMTFGTHAEFPIAHAAASVYAETNLALNVNLNSIPANVIADVGLFRRGGSTAYAPTDGVYFRFTSAGLTAVVNNNGVEQTFTVGTTIPGISMLANENHRYTASITEREVEFWIDDVRVASIAAATTWGQVVRSASLPWSTRLANTNAVTPGALQVLITDYTVSYGGPIAVASLATIGNRSLGSHQGLSGGTMGSLAVNVGNSAAMPTPAAGSNTTPPAVGLGGIAAINAAVSAATDFLLTSYQVPQGSLVTQGRRLVLTGVKISGVNLGAAVATTPTTVLLGLAFGHTAASLATTETGSFVTATTKAPRKEALGFMYWPVAAPIGATPQNGDVVMKFDTPIYVNPGEFIATTLKFVAGTATASQSLAFAVTFDYGWE